MLHFASVEHRSCKRCMCFEAKHRRHIHCSRMGLSIHSHYCTAQLCVGRWVATGSVMHSSSH